MSRHQLAELNFSLLPGVYLERLTSGGDKRPKTKTNKGVAEFRQAEKVRAY